MVSPKSNLWLIYAFGAANFASLTAILGKVGIGGRTNLGTRSDDCCLDHGLIAVFVTKKQKTIKEIDQRSWLFLVLSLYHRRFLVMLLPCAAERTG